MGPWRFHENSKGAVIDLSEEWHRYPAAQRALQNTLTLENILQVNEKKKAQVQMSLHGPARRCKSSKIRPLRGIRLSSSLLLRELHVSHPVRPRVLVCH